MLLSRQLPRNAALYLLVWLFFSAASVLQAQTASITFRLADPQKRYVRAFVPGEFNNWGPNSGGRISSGAVSEMSYDAASGAWTKTLTLNVGQRYLYKFHIHRDASGAQADWLPDPLNDVQDGSGNQNSVLTVAPLLIFQPTLNVSNNAVSGVSASIIVSARLTRLAVVAGTDTTAITGAALNTAQMLGFLQMQFPRPIATTASVRILALDTAGNSASYRFPVSINAVPAWASNVVWYQIFPERFRNGDPSNDPTRESLELGNGVSDKWRVKEWGSDWFARDEWEREFGGSFYTNAIFHRRYGGDLQGVMDKLDYLKDLGITGIYLNPIFYANSLHKYDGNAHHHIDPYFGPNPRADLEQIARENASAAPYDPKTWQWTSADSLFLKLISEAKRRGMRIIIDGVFNHTGRGFFAFQDIQKNQAQSRFKDWYAVSRYDDPATAQNEFAYKSWENFTSLPEFARTADGRDLAPAPKDYIWNITRRWMDPNGDGNPSDGVDGWRLDVVPYMPLGFWNEWNVYVRSINPNSYTTAEIWTDATPATVRGGNFSAAMNYWAFTLPVVDFFVNGRGTAESFWNVLETRRNAYPPSVQTAMQNMMDSHDTERLASMIANRPTTSSQALWQPAITRNAWGTPSYAIRKPTQRERDVQKLIALFQMTYTGAPMLYYGTESGVWGGQDPDDRSPMNWQDIRFAPQAGTHSPAFLRTVDDMNFDSSLVRFYRNSLIARKQFVVNLTGTPGLRSTVQFYRLPSNPNVLIFGRLEGFGNGFGWSDQISGNSYMTAIFNLSSDSAVVTFRDSTRLFNVLGNPIISTHGAPKILDFNRSNPILQLPPFAGMIWSSTIINTSVKPQLLEEISAHAYPQPFTDETTLEYTLTTASEVGVSVVDVLGREVVRVEEGWKPQGTHTLAIHGAHLARGTYYCTLRMSGGVVKRMVLMRE
jgi:glycosidase